MVANAMALYRRSVLIFLIALSAKQAKTDPNPPRELVSGRLIVGWSSVGCRQHLPLLSSEWLLLRSVAQRLSRAFCSRFAPPQFEARRG